MKTKGMTFIGMLLTMALVLFSGVTLMKAAPVYLQYYAIVSSIKSLNQLPTDNFSTDPAANAQVLKNKLTSQLYIDSIDFITPDQIIVSYDDENRYKVSITYQVTRPFLGNVSLLFKFSATGEVKLSV